MKRIVIGTAGHVDHGKTALVRALTGINADRLAEEKRRGLTVDLGFAWMELPGEVHADIVDVPGHEHFVKNMLAGAGGIDLALLVVAADEGVVIAANKWGKVKTVSQIIAIAFILAMQYAQELIAAGTLSAFSVGGIPSETVFLWTGEGLMAVTVFFTVLSGGIYLKQNWKVIGNSK